jgi:hypothetical protein
LGFHLAFQDSRSIIVSLVTGFRLGLGALGTESGPGGQHVRVLGRAPGRGVPEAGYADLLAQPGVGRPSLPTTQTAAVRALQSLHEYSGRHNPCQLSRPLPVEVGWMTVGAPADMID